MKVDRFRGMLQILRYNWPAYVAAVAAAVLLVVLGSVFPKWAAAAWTGAALVFLGSAWTLLAAHLVYDRSDLYDFDWLPSGGVDSWASLHGGLDDATARLAARYPDATGVSIDLWGPETMPGRSARRARRDATRRALTASPSSLPLGSESQDVLVLAFFAHELSTDHRLALFRDVGRTLRKTGRAYLVEHLRDAPNFAAFGPGAFHFLSRRTWLRNITESGMRVASMHRVAGLVSVWSLEAA